MATQTVHFTIGKDLGIRLHEISLEHLYNLDVDRAVKVWTESLHCPEETGFMLATLTYYCDVENEKGDVSIKRPKTSDRRFQKDYPKLNMRTIYNAINDNFTNTLEVIKKIDIDNIDFNTILSYRNNISSIDGIVIEKNTAEIKAKEIVEYLIEHNGNLPKGLDIVEDAYDVDYAEKLELLKIVIPRVITVINNWQQINNLKSCLSMHLTWLDDAHRLIVEWFSNLRLKLETNVQAKPQRLKIDMSDYVESENHIAKQISDFKPVNITDKYDAGWLAPDGTFFGLNGSISNLLHVKLANAIVDYYKYKVTDKHDSYDYLLCKKGFCKIHHDWILFEGYDLINKPIVGITEAQVNALVKYGEQCYGQKLFWGYAKKFCSTINLKMLDKVGLKKLLENKL